MLLGIVAFGCASCAFILHEIRKAPLGMEVGGRFFICEKNAPGATYASAADTAVGSGNLVRT